MKLKPFGCTSDLVIVDWLMTVMWKKNHYLSKNKNESKIKEEKIDEGSNIVKNKQLKNSSNEKVTGTERRKNVEQYNWGKKYYIWKWTGQSYVSTYHTRGLMCKPKRKNNHLFGLRTIHQHHPLYQFDITLSTKLRFKSESRRLQQSLPLLSWTSTLLVSHYHYYHELVHFLSEIGRASCRERVSSPV